MEILNYNLTSSLRNSPVVDDRKSSALKGRRYDNVLPDQGNCIQQGLAINEYGYTGMMISMGNQIEFRGGHASVPHHPARTNMSPGTEPRAPLLGYNA